MPLDLVKCGMCDKAVVIERGTKPVCQDCRQEEQELYRRVRALLTDYGDRRFTIQDVAGALGVEEKKITYLVDNGYFQLIRSHIMLEDNKRL
ncbi:MAG: hypothetical protein LBQ58_09070 [Synergistaceae bacterium]|nr:hypothetical protein [Synergistaceae bacterium]